LKRTQRRGRNAAARNLASAAPVHQRLRQERYQGWGSELGRRINNGEFSLSTLVNYAEQQSLDPQPRARRQELAESLITRHCTY
jgi:xylose isomerase